MEKEILTFIETKFETGTDAKQIKIVEILPYI